MNKLSIILLTGIAAGSIIGCSNDVKRKPGKIYMPDMTYSRAYETFAPHKNLADEGINYNNMPVTGTIKRGELLPFPIAKDKPGDSVNYLASRQVQNPLGAGTLDSVQSKEAERIYLINCGICHGAKLDGNGPLYRGGDGPYPAAPKNFIGDAGMIAMPEGQMFYSVTYGKNLMGSYASQLSTTQRWMIIKYIKEMQSAAKKPAESAPESTDKK